MRTALAAAALGISLTTAGLVSCAGDGGPPITPGPAPSATPVFASEEEALAAAEGVYARYEAIANQVGQSGWVDTAPFAEVLTGEALADEVSGAEEVAAKGYRQVGESTYDTVSLQQVRDAGPGTVSIVVYLCSDVSEVDVVDGSGSSVVSPTRPDRQALEVGLVDLDGQLKIERVDAWSGTSFC